MATVAHLKPSRLPIPVWKTKNGEPNDIPSSRHSHSHGLLSLGQVLLGGMLLLLGGALTITLWLLPIGLPVALLGTALIAAPKST